MPFDLTLPNIDPGDALQLSEKMRELEGRIQVLENDTMRIIEHYVDDRCYKKGAVVRVNNGYTMCYLKDSCDSPQIQPYGDAFWVSGDTDPPSLGWTKSAFTASSKTRGNEYRLLDGKNYLVQGARFYVPHNANTQDYTIFHGRYLPEIAEWTYETIQQHIQSTAEGTYVNIPYAALWRAGELHRMGVRIRSLGSTTSFSGYWQQKNENGSPSSGEATFQNSQTEIRFHYTDKNDDNHETALRGVPVGATLKRGSTEWQITDVDQRGSHVRFTVSPGGQRGGENEYTYVFEYGSAEPLYHYEVDDHWLLDPYILGFWANNGDEIQVNKDQYMVDIQAIEVYASPDVAVVSLE